MFIHLILGALVTIILGAALEFRVDWVLVVIGGAFGILPDVVSLLFKDFELNGNFHGHRNNISHSIFLPLALAGFLYLVLGWRWALLGGAATLTHPLMDMIGMGWGVRLFYPFSRKAFKLFYNGKWLYVFKPKELEKVARKKKNDTWFKEIFLRWNFWAVVEWMSVLVFLGIVGWMMIK